MLRLIQGSAPAAGTEILISPTLQVSVCCHLNTVFQLRSIPSLASSYFCTRTLHNVDKGKNGFKPAFNFIPGMA